MKKHFITIIILISSFICFSGCTNQQTSTTITIDIESFYSFDIEGYFTIDGIRLQNFTVGLFEPNSYKINKSILPEQQYHNVSIHAQSGEEMINASCDKVTSYVKFVLSIDFSISCPSYE